VVDSVAVLEETPATLAAKMMGAELAAEPEPRQHTPGEVRLALKSLNQSAEDEFGIPLRDINLGVRSGEILGIAGVAGNGQDELLKVISGEVMTEPGAVQIDGRDCGRLDPNARRLLGLSSIPEERLGHGAVPGMSLTGNGLLTAFVRLQLSSAGFINWASCEKFANGVIERFDVKSSGVDAPAASLSGGNLQKYIVGREICQDPELLVVSQPTWGVDAGAARTIHDALRTLAERGTAVLVISQDLDELLRLSDRVAAICAGSVSASYPVGNITVEQIGLLMAGANRLDDVETADVA
jgi:simple sugar transport system ATP-binding protein